SKMTSLQRARNWPRSRPSQGADARAKRDRRRQRVGTLAEAAGLLIWDDTTLAGLFQILAALRETPRPGGRAGAPPGGPCPYRADSRCRWPLLPHLLCRIGRVGRLQGGRGSVLS